MSSQTTYRAAFSLVSPVNDRGAAQHYLVSDDMTPFLVSYLASDAATAPAAQTITRVIWLLTSDNTGYVEVDTTEELAAEDSKIISEWIGGQCSNGLGEGFEQQPFADLYPVQSFWYDEDDEDDDEWRMASFDWKTNQYQLVKIG
jgi:hypothetical protein